MLKSWVGHIGRFVWFGVSGRSGSWREGCSYIDVLSSNGHRVLSYPNVGM